MGEHFTIADAYLAWALMLAQRVGATLAPAALAYVEENQKRPAVQAAIAAEMAAAPKS